MRLVSLAAGIAFASLVVPQAAATAAPQSSAQAASQAAASSGQERPVQKIILTRAQGEPTQLAQAGLETVNIGSGHALTRISRATLQGQGTSSFDPSQDAAILTQPLSVDPFLVTGLSWSGKDSLASGTQIYIRVRERGEWSQWYLTDGDGGAGKDRVDGHNVRGGTDPFVTAGADAIQVRVTGKESDLPSDLEVAMVPENPQGETVLSENDLDSVAAANTDLNQDSVQENSPSFASQIESSPAAQSGEGEEAEFSAQNTDVDQEAVETDNARSGVITSGVGSGQARGLNGTKLARAFPATVQPNGLPVAVTSRSGWGADESYLDWDPEYFTASHVVVHHTAGTNNYTMDQSASIVRGIYHYHAVTLDWGDIGYNFLVDKWGRAFEGRKGTLSSPAGKMVAGAHDQGFNSGTMGISMMGTYQSEAPSQATLNTVGALAGWQLRRAGVTNMSESAGFRPKGSNPKYRAGTYINLARISGHRDTYPTSCPGDAGYSKLPTIRQIAQNGAQDSRSASASANNRPDSYTVKGAIWGLWNDNKSLMGNPKSNEEASAPGVYQLFDRGTAYWTAQTDAHFVGGKIFVEYGNQRYERGVLKFPTSNEYSAGSGRAQEFQGGTITWTQNSGSHTLRYGTGIANAFRELGGAKVLGAATSNETPSGSGVFQVFEKGTAYWKAENGTHFVRGRIFDKYGSTGYERGSLGYPTSDEYAVASGRAQEFEGGVITTSNSGTYVLRYGTGIANAYRDLGGAQVVGLPTTSETPSGKGVFQVFEYGTAYWTAEGGTHFVRNGIFGAYGASGYERGFLGYPLSDEYSAGSGRAQEFEGGVITWSSDSGTYVLRYGTGIANAYRDLGGAKVLGVTRSAETTSGKGVFQLFDKGTAYWSPTTGSHFVRGHIFEAYGRSGYERGGYGYPTSDEFWSGGSRVQYFEGGRIAS